MRLRDRDNCAVRHALSRSRAQRSRDLRLSVGRSRCLTLVAAWPYVAQMPAVRIHVVVNGDPKEILRGTTVAALLEGLRLQPRHVAVEWNRNRGPRAQHAHAFWT